MKKRAILCVDDTSGIIDLARCLVNDDWELISAGQTGRLLSSENIPYTDVPALVESPRTFSEYMTLYRSILITGHQNDRSYYSDDNSEIQMVCINIQPYLKPVSAFTDLGSSGEGIDMRASSFVQAACKNYKTVLVLTDPDDYQEAMIQIRTESVSDDFRLYLAGKAFNMISAVNASAGDSILLQTGNNMYPRYFTIPYAKSAELKSGAADHQSAGLYKLPESIGALGGIKKLQGKELTYSLYIDIDAVWKELCLFSSQLKNPGAASGTDCEGNPTVTQFTPAAGSVFTCSVKHGIPVGAAIGSNVAESYYKMYRCCSASLGAAAAGFSAVVNEDAAAALARSDLHAVIAPGFTAEARIALAAKKDMRLITMSKPAILSYDFRSLDGGLLVQSADTMLFNGWNFVTKTRPSQTQIDEMEFGQLMLMGAHQDSAVIVKDMASAGMCCAAMVPADACLAALDHAIKNVKAGLTNSPDNAEVLVCGSALPFSSELLQLADNGIRAILQPGGTPEDGKFISFCNDHGISMVFTGIEHLGC